MSLLAFSLAAALAQTEPGAQAEAPAATPAASPAAASPDPAAASSPGFRASRAPSPEEMTRQLERIRKLPGSEMGEALDEFRRKFPTVDPARAAATPAYPPTVEAAAPTLHDLNEAEQVRYYARAAFNNIIAGDARSLVLQSAYPFQLEDRRLEMPDELHKEWLKNLRSKRTDLLTLYDVEVLTPAEMERKYGRPPARLSALPWKAPHTYLAVGNLSGHAAVAVFRAAAGGGWQLVGYHD